MGNYKGEDRQEKHYTPEYLLDELFELLDTYHKEPILEYLENSAGSGNIIDYIKSKRSCKDYIAFDINNETKRIDIKECNYLKEKIEYKPGRVAVINPPFNLGLKFVYKALKECDYCVSILSINSFLNIDYDKYEVDKIWIYRKIDFGTCKTSICMIAIKNKV